MCQTDKDDTLLFSCCNSLLYMLLYIIRYVHVLLLFCPVLVTKAPGVRGVRGVFSFRDGFPRCGLLPSLATRDGECLPPTQMSSDKLSPTSVM